MKYTYIFDDTHPLRPYTYTMEANTHPNALPPTNSLPMAPRLGNDGTPLPGEWPCAKADRTGWDYAKDHRSRRDARGREIEGSGTPYWMPGDTWQASARYNDDIGPLPEGALLTRPEKPLSVAQTEKRAEIIAAHSAVLAYMLADTPAPTPIDAALAVEDMRADDPDGLAYVRGLADTRRDELLGLVDAAESTAAVEAIVVTYPV